MSGSAVSCEEGEKMCIYPHIYSTLACQEVETEINYLLKRSQISLFSRIREDFTEYIVSSLALQK